MNNNNLNIPTAVFIDGDWLYFATRRINRQINYVNFFNILINKFGAKTKIYFYGAINSTDKQQVKFYTSLKKIGYIVHCVELIKRKDTFVVKGLEIELALDAMQILPLLKKFVLISGDNDFVPLLKKAINYNVSVSVIALPFTTGYLLKKIVGGSFLNLEALINKQKSVTKLPVFKKERKIKLLDKKTVKILKIIQKDKKIEIIAPNSLYITKGEHFNSYINIRNLMISAKNSITIIDSYIDDQILTMIELLKREINIIIFTQKTNPVDFCLQVKKLRDEGKLITIYKTNTFHDRFIGVDSIWWHSGHSFKDLGGKDSMLNKVTDKVVLAKLKIRITEESQNSEEICGK